MSNIDIEKSLKRALYQVPDIDLQAIINTPVIKMTQHDSITEQRKQNSRSVILKVKRTLSKDRE